ncbi:MAG: HAD-IIB family hydrolase [Acidiferrobacterales bacterium]|nr:HAD-IIB family hydrolase [Acidiferrobacterales bacterium]
MAIIVYTDLDGSLLDHDSYQLNAASEYLKALEANGIRVIFVTSKTRSEVEQLRKELNHFQPFVVENGAAAYLPVENAHAPKETLAEQSGYYVKPFGSKRVQWLELLEKAKSHFPGCFKGFIDYKVEEIAKLTGLSLDQARSATNREFTEPVSWTGDEKRLTDFIGFMSQNGASVVRGGRFLHISDGSTKGAAVRWLSQYYAQTESVQTVAVGDSENDISMLEIADHAVVVHNPKGNTIKISQRAGKEIVYTNQPAPEGWVEGVSHLIEKLETGDA